MVRKVSGSQPKWPIYVDLTEIFKELPMRATGNGQRETEEKIYNKTKRMKKKKGKKGNSEDLSTGLLREILGEMSEPYSKS